MGRVWNICRDILIQFVLEYLNQKYELSELEKDILSTVAKYNEIPFDRNGAENKVIENNVKYRDIEAAVKMVSGIEVIPFAEVSDEDVRVNLKMQIEAMCLKEYNIIEC